MAEQSPLQFLTPEESAEVDTALMSSSEKFLTRITISSLRVLTTIAADLKVPLGELTHTQVIQWMEKEAKVRREHGIDAAVLKW